MNDRSVVRGAAAGLLAGLAASFAMDRFQAVITSLSTSAGSGEPATDKAADEIAGAVIGQRLTKPDRRVGGQLVHYAFGAGLGAVYGISAELRREVTTGRGALFGLGVAALFDDAAVPALGLGAPPWKTDLGTHVYSLASHLIFGAALEFGRAGIRATLLSGPETPNATRSGARET